MQQIKWNYRKLYNLNHHQLILNCLRYDIALYNNKIHSINYQHKIKIEKENKKHIYNLINTAEYKKKKLNLIHNRLIMEIYYHYKIDDNNDENMNNNNDDEKYPNENKYIT
eukprot:477736_1